MCKRIIILGLAVLIVFFILGVPEPQELSAASARTSVGTIAYVRPNDTTGDEIWLIEPDGSHNRRIYSTGIADPYSVRGINSMAWRPDAGELVFTSDHENDCSWYASDLYAIFADGSGYRRVTNAPACAALANYPKGTVILTTPAADSFYQLYVQGAPSIKSYYSGPGGVITFDNVADLGNIVQPVIAINGKYRYMTSLAVDVKAGQTVNAGVLSLTTSGIDTLGAYGPAWRSDGSRIGYAFGCAQLYGMADQSPAGNTGQPLFNANGVSPCGLTWGPTTSTANQIVYYNNTGNPGIYRTTEGSSSAGTLLVSTDVYLVIALQYLPDASGIVFTLTDGWGDTSNIYRYDFASDTVTQLTFYTDQYARDFSLSPDGQTIVYELAPQAWGAPLGGASDLWMMRTDGSNQQLFKTGGAHPSWSINAVQLPKAPVKLYLPFIKR